MTLEEGRPYLLKAREASRMREAVFRGCWDFEVFVNCAASVDTKHQRARELTTEYQKMWAAYGQAIEPVNQFLISIPDALVDEYFQDPAVQYERFFISHLRKEKASLLSLKEERLISGLALPGFQAWERLYYAVSGSLQCEVDTGDGVRQMGVAEALGYANSHLDRVRKSSFFAVQRAFEAQEETFAAILKNLALWRHEVDARRSHTHPVHFLDDAVHAGRISRASLDAMMEAVKHRGFPVGRRALRLKAKLLGKPCLDPWDGGAPFPEKNPEKAEKYVFSEAIRMIRAAYQDLSPEMGSFVDRMVKENWIEAGVGPSRKSGAYCTRFAAAGEPRIFMTYMGSMYHVKTLAHEMGHAYHAWVVRDQTLVESTYPLTLAETASIFSENLFADFLSRSAQNDLDRLRAGWIELGNVGTFLLNLPARYIFEKDFYERIKTRDFSPADLKQSMEAAWREAYGDSISDVDRMFWASKPHFNYTDVRFYNFPYVFGYLFAVGVYAQRRKRGARAEEFFTAYRSLLADCGRATAEDLALRHLQVDLTKPKFWEESIAIVEGIVNECETLADAYLAGPA